MLVPERRLGGRGEIVLMLAFAAVLILRVTQF